MDVLAPFRRPGATQADIEATPPADDGGSYEAFTMTAPGAPRPLRLEVRPTDDLFVARPYSQLAEIAYEQDYSALFLFFGTTRVIVKGHSLKPLVEAVIAGTCERLTQAASRQQAAAGKAFIETITTMKPKPPAKQG